MNNQPLDSYGQGSRDFDKLYDINQGKFNQDQPIIPNPH